MTDPIRWGILSTGAIATTFVNDLRLLPDAEVTAVGSRTAATATAFAERHGIARAHGSWHELAADPDVDVIYVATPHAAHLDATLACLALGKAVLTEKPLARPRLGHPAGRGGTVRRGVPHGGHVDQVLPGDP
jgi:predicted dehydrogenase